MIPLAKNKEIFSRTEVKFLLNDRQYAAVMRDIYSRMLPDPHTDREGLSTVMNLYYDTEDHQLIRHSLSKPTYKEKLRLRSYGTVQPGDEVFLEIKKKVSGLVNKRRTGLLLFEAELYLARGQRPVVSPNINGQVIRECDVLLGRYALRPACFIGYDRAAYFSPEGDFRVTFDRNLRARRESLSLMDGDWGEPILDEQLCLMEAKAEKGLPLWFVQLLSREQIRGTSFSKYGAEFKSHLAAEAVPLRKSNLYKGA